MGEIRFYEGASCSQHYIGKISSQVDSTWDLTLKSAPIPDREAQSCTLIDVQKGARVILFDTAYETGDDTCTEIIVKSDIAERCVLSFTEAYVDGEVEVVLHNGKGVQSTVSRIKVQTG